MKIFTTLLTFIFAIQIGCAQQIVIKDTLSIDDIALKSVELPQELDEISTLVYEDNDKSVVSFWGLNDSANKSEIYRFTEDGKIIQTLYIENASNIDWEEMDSDEHRLYFADFGNNLGKRKDLAIYYINRKDINFSLPFQSLKAQKIEFFYPEQETFGYKNLTTNWDAEAFFIYNDRIHILTKEWGNKSTTHYTIPIDSSQKHPAKKIETFSTGYMVTGAQISTKSQTKGLYLIGYTLETLAVLQWFDLPQNPTDQILTYSPNITTIPLGFTTQLGQLEGISLSSTDKNQICISGEEFKYKGYHTKQVLHCFKNFTNQK